MTTTPSPHPHEGAPRSPGLPIHPGQAKEKTLFEEAAAPSLDLPPAPQGSTDTPGGSEPVDVVQEAAVEPIPAKRSGMEWLDEDPFPPPPSFLLPGEHLRKSMEKCIDYIIQHEGLGRNAGFEQFLFLLCAKLFEERNPASARRFWADEKEAREDGGCAAIRTRVAALFDELKEALPAVFGSGDRFTLSDRSIAFVVSALGKHCLSATELDPLGVAYQQWTSAAARYDRGQFLTPVGTALFALCMLDPQEHERALDFTCGCGAFLTALYIYRASQLGLEFAEGIPAVPRLAEAVPLGQAPERLARYMRTQVYGAEIDAFLCEIARKQLALAQGDPAHIYRMDSLAFPDGEGDAARAAADIPFGSISCIVGNPPFGGRIGDEAVLSRYELARTWTRQGEHNFQREERISKRVKSETLFLEQALNWLKPGGRLALVVPDGVLAERSTEYARDWLLNHAVLLAVVSLPDEVFSVESGTHTKTSVLLMRKMYEAEMQRNVREPLVYSIFMAMAERAGYDSRGRTLYKRGPDGEEIRYNGRKLIDDELPIVLSRYRQFRSSPHLSPPPA